MRWTLALVGLAAPLLFVPYAQGADTADRGGAGPITVQGEAPVETNIPTGYDRRATGGAYLSLDTLRPAPDDGWYATYEVDAPSAGVYRLDSVLTTPAMPDRRPFGGSQFNLSVNGAPFAQVAKSEPAWGGFREAPSAWGSLVDTTVGDIELRRGTNTITFMVDERRISASPQLDKPRRKPSPPRFRLHLDELTLTRTRLALDGVHLGNPHDNLGTYRDDREAWLHFRLNGHARAAQTVRYRIVDYFGDRVGGGSATVQAGASRVAVGVPHDLPPGSYRVTAWLTTAPKDATVAHFARLPEQEAVRGPENRFAVTTTVPWLVPSSRLEAFAAALHDVGTGYAREEISWPLVEPRPGTYDFSPENRIVRVFREHGIKTLSTLWNMSGSGNAEAPRWAKTEASDPLPGDLRPAYRLGRQIASQTDGIGRDAIELWNEPDIDVGLGAYSSSGGDQYAAFVKAAALGIADSPTRPLVSLPGVATPGVLQELMMQNGVARYADIWAYHSYGGFGGPGFAVPRVENELRRLYTGDDLESWMTESGNFLQPKSPTHDLTPEQQVFQARYLVKSTVTDFAAGSDKHFWFAAAPYCASGGACFGLLSRDFQPWASYSAYAAMTSVLGEADYTGPARRLPRGVQGHRFDGGDDIVRVLWAPKPTRVTLDPATDVEVHNIMGERVRVVSADDGPTTVRARRDPIYLVADDNGTAAEPDRATDSGLDDLSEAEHIVLAQRFAPAAMPKPLPYGYQLKRHTPMSVDVYNFDDAAQTVTLQPHTYGGWTIRPRGDRTVTVPAGDRTRVPFTITAGPRVDRRVDYPLVFDATLDGEPVSPSVSRIQLGRSGPPGAPIRLRPRITDIRPATDVVTGPRVRLTARVTDALSGVDPDSIRVEVDGRPVAVDYDPGTGRLVAPLQLAPGRHEIWIAAYNNAHAPWRVTGDLTVRRR